MRKEKREAIPSSFFLGSNDFLIRVQIHEQHQDGTAQSARRFSGPASTRRRSPRQRHCPGPARPGQCDPGQGDRDGRQAVSARASIKQAERVCRQIIEARPANADAQNILGVCLNALGQPKEAIAALRRAVKLAPTAASIHANLGEVLRQAGQQKEAAKALETAIKLDPNNAQALNNLGIIRYEQGKYRRGGRILPPRARRPARPWPKRTTISAMPCAWPAMSTARCRPIRKR